MNCNFSFCYLPKIEGIVESLDAFIQSSCTKLAKRIRAPSSRFENKQNCVKRKISTLNLIARMIKHKKRLPSTWQTEELDIKTNLICLQITLNSGQWAAKKTPIPFFLGPIITQIVTYNYYIDSLETKGLHREKDSQSILLMFKHLTIP